MDWSPASNLGSRYSWSSTPKSGVFLLELKSHAVQVAASVAKIMSPTELLLVRPYQAKAPTAQQLAWDLYTDESKTSTAHCCSLYLQDTIILYMAIVIRFISAYWALGQWHIIYKAVPIGP